MVEAGNLLGQVAGDAAVVELDVSEAPLAGFAAVLEGEALPGGDVGVEVPEVLELGALLAPELEDLLVGESLELARGGDALVNLLALLGLLLLLVLAGGVNLDVLLVVFAVAEDGALEAEIGEGRGR